MASDVTERVLALGGGPAEPPGPPLPMSVGGVWQPAVGGRSLRTVEPATGRVLAELSDGSADDVDLAVERAAAAQPAWGELPPARRADAVLALADRLAERAEELALLDARDNGSPLAAMRADVAKGVASMRRTAGLASELKGQTIPASSGRLHYTACEPWGTVARIIAFNHPILFAAARLAPALVAGNAVILKPSELASLSTLALAGLADGVLPPGLLSVLTGGPGLGAAIAGHREIRRLSFTGSPSTALKVQAQAAASGVIKTITMELGGKNPILVLPDADVEEAARAVVRGMNFTRVQGQSCGSTSRLFVHEDLREPLVRRVVELVEAIRVGDPTDPDVEMGALISADAADRVLGLVRRAVDDGARVLVGGDRPADPALAGGAFVLPTVLDRIDHASPIAQTEVFGPVLSVFSWTDLDECVRLANDTEYGLTASVWTRDLDLALRTVRRLEAGYVWVNDVELRFGGVPFGGWKNSGSGLEDGLEELLSFTRTRVVNVRYAAG